MMLGYAFLSSVTEQRPIELTSYLRLPTFRVSNVPKFSNCMRKSTDLEPTEGRRSSVEACQLKSTPVVHNPEHKTPARHDTGQKKFLEY